MLNYSQKETGETNSSQSLIQNKKNNTKKIYRFKYQKDYCELYIDHASELIFLDIAHKIDDLFEYVTLPQSNKTHSLYYSLFKFDDVFYKELEDKKEDLIFFLEQIDPAEYKKKASIVDKQITKSFEKAITNVFDKKDLAERFIELQPLFYDAGKNFWVWHFESKSWERKDEIDICNLISELSNANTINSKERSEVLEALKQVGRLKHPKEMKKTWIQFRNIIVDVKTRLEYTPCPDYFCTNPIPWDLSENEETPVIDKLFEEWVGKDYVLTLKEIMAYCMLPDYPIHRIFCFLGAGRNGKSKYLKLIENMIGENNVSAVELDTLMSSRFEMFNLYKKLAVQMGETNFSTMSRTAILKKLTGQDKVSFEAKNKDSVSDVNYAKLLISTNNLPETEDKTDGFFRRWIAIDFPNNYPEGKEILDRIPEEEYGNFCRASIKILYNLLDKGGFHNEGSIPERQKRYEERSNPFDKFIRDNCVEYDDEHIFKFEFKIKFEDWCKENRFRPPTDTFIGKKMNEKSFRTQKIAKDIFNKEKGVYEEKYIRAWTGIGWKTKLVPEELEQKSQS